MLALSLPVTKMAASQPGPTSHVYATALDRLLGPDDPEERLAAIASSRMRRLADAFFDDDADPIPKRQKQEPEPPAPPVELDPWKSYEIKLFPDNLWWTWDEGIVDLRLLWFNRSPQASEGVLYRAASLRIRWVLRKRECEFKVGIASNLSYRWLMYRSEGWQPSHLFIVHDVPGRVAAGYVESALIAMLKKEDHPCIHNLNFSRGDLGGTGPRTAEREHAKWFIYLAVLPTCE